MCPKAGACSVSKETGEPGVERARGQVEGTQAEVSGAWSWKALETL